MARVAEATRLAIDGGTPAVTSPLPQMYPGGMRIGREEEEAVLEVLRSKRLFRYYGPQSNRSWVSELEEAFAEVMGVQHAAAVSSGSAALMCALAGLGVGPGDEVIVPGLHLDRVGLSGGGHGGRAHPGRGRRVAHPRPSDVRRKITRFTKAIIPVHMRGAPSQMDELMAIAREHKLPVLEDVAQADGGSYHGSATRQHRRRRRLQPAVQQDHHLRRRRHGDDQRRCHFARASLMYNDVVGGQRNKIPDDEILPGINFRMSELQGAVALVQLGRLDDLLTDMRRRKAEIKEGIAGVARQQGRRVPPQQRP